MFWSVIPWMSGSIRSGAPDPKSAGNQDGQPFADHLRPRVDDDHRRESDGGGATCSGVGPPHLRRNMDAMGPECLRGGSTGRPVVRRPGRAGAHPCWDLTPIPDHRCRAAAYVDMVDPGIARHQPHGRLRSRWVPDHLRCPASNSPLSAGLLVGTSPHRFGTREPPMGRTSEKIWLTQSRDVSGRRSGGSYRRYRGPFRGPRGDLSPSSVPPCGNADRTLGPRRPHRPHRGALRSEDVCPVGWSPGSATRDMWRMPHRPEVPGRPNRQEVLTWTIQSSGLWHSGFRG
jgi:hypothetical protein